MTEAKTDFGTLFAQLRRRRVESPFGGKNKRRANAKLYKYRNRVRTAKEWALYCNITVRTFKLRVKAFRRNPRKHPPGWVFRRVL